MKDSNIVNQYFSEYNDMWGNITYYSNYLFESYRFKRIVVN